MGNKNLISIREANPNDAKGIALVHYHSWNETYTGLMPEAILKGISLEGREKLWTMILANQNGSVWVAETDTGEVIGFLSICAGRDEKYKNYGEIPGLYLLKKYHSRGIGKNLLSKGLELLKEQGFKSVYLWCLKNNPSELFYRKMGAIFDGEKVFEIDGSKMTEVFYVWENL